MNIIIFEDDKEFAEDLKSHITQLGHSIVLITDSILELRNHLLDSTFSEVYLLDILIENTTTGIEAFNLIREFSKNSLCIFITNHLDLVTFNPELKINSFSHISKQKLNELPITLQLAAEELSDKNFFRYNSKYQKISISLNGIFYIESNNGGIIYIYHEAGIFSLRASLHFIMKQLNSDFILCHRSYIVNKCQFQKIDFENRQLILKNGLKCPFTRSRINTWLP